MQQKLIPLIAGAIVAAGALIAGAAVYLGTQLADRPDETRVIALIEERLAQVPAPEPAAQTGRASGEREILALIDKRLKERKLGPVSDQEFEARVERGIVAVIEKQRQGEEARSQQLAARVPPPGKDDHVYGNRDAPVTLIEYSDFECPFCKRFHPTAKQLVDKSNGRVNWVYRHFPIESHNPGAQKQAEASECAAELGGNDAFWKYTDTIYARTRSGGKGFPVANLVPLAGEIGLDRDAFRQCLDSGKHAPKVQQQLLDAQRAGITGTPGNILLHTRSRKAVPVIGAQPYERLQEIATRLLESN